MEDIKNSRERITEIDREMARLFEERMEAAKEIAAYKKERGLPVKDEAREEYLLCKNAGYISDPTVKEYYYSFQKNIMELSCNYQQRLNQGMRIAYSGVPGAFAYIAAKKMFPGANYISFGSFEEAYEATEKGGTDAAVLPVENSFAGEVGDVMDLMFKGSLYVNRVVDIDVVQNLLAADGATVRDIKKVISHPQALAQCKDYIKAHNFETEVSSNTALAAGYVKDLNDKSVAAIASAETAAIYGLNVIESSVNTSRSNTTRFACFSRIRNKPNSPIKKSNEHFILVFTVKNEAGALAKTLNIIGAHDFNMKSLRSRPMKNLMWNYFFYLEAEGCVNTPDGQDMLRELGALCADMKLVGTY